MSRTKKHVRVQDQQMLFARLGPVTYRPPSELIAYKRNARKHPERQLVALEASIREFGFNVPVLVATNNEIIAGHARVQAAQRAGLVEIPTISAEHLSPAQVKAYRLADNRLPELATWDMEALAVELDEIVSLDEIEVESMGWSTAEVDVLLTAGEASGGEADPADTQREPPVMLSPGSATYGCSAVTDCYAAHRSNLPPGCACSMAEQRGWCSPTLPST